MEHRVFQNMVLSVFVGFGLVGGDCFGAQSQPSEQVRHVSVKCQDCNRSVVGAWSCWECGHRSSASSVLCEECDCAWAECGACAKLRAERLSQGAPHAACSRPAVSEAEVEHKEMEHKVERKSESDRPVVAPESNNEEAADIAVLKCTHCKKFERYRNTTLCCPCYVDFLLIVNCNVVKGVVEEHVKTSGGWETQDNRRLQSQLQKSEQLKASIVEKMARNRE